MTDPRADKYSHTPRRVFDKAIDRQDVKRQRLHGVVRELQREVSLLRQQHSELINAVEAYLGVPDKKIKTKL